MDIKKQVDEIISEIIDLHAPAILEIDNKIIKKTQIVSILKSFNYSVFEIEGSPKDKNELLLFVKEACQFPKYFGANWDALADSLSDFHWIEATGYLLLFKYPPKLNIPDWKIFLNIVHEVNVIWRGEGKVFKILVPIEAQSA